MKLQRLALNGILAVGLATPMVLVGLPAAVNAASAAAPAFVAATTVTPGLTLTGSETLLADGSVNATWADANGSTYEYTGPQGGQLDVSMTGDATSGAVTMDAAMTEDSSPTAVHAWCVKAIISGFHHISGCNSRKTLQKSNGNNFIADDMEAQGHTIAFTHLTQEKIWMVYPNTHNQVIHLDPLGTVKDHCTTQNFGVTWYGISFTSNNTVCGGSLSPFGQSSNNAGGNWVGSSSPGDVIGIEPILQTNAPFSTNPTSTLHLRASWTT